MAKAKRTRARAQAKRRDGADATVDAITAGITGLVVADKLTDQRWKLVKTHLEKGDQAKDKAEQHYISAGQYLTALKAEHTGTWPEWEALLKERAGIGKSRASELMQIAGGTKTVKQLRGSTAKRMKRLRDRKSSPSRDGETKGAPAATKPEATALVWKREGHDTGAQTSAGSYTTGKLDIDLWATHFYPGNKGPALCLGESTSLRAAKDLAQAHSSEGRETAPAPAPVTAAPAPAPVTATAEGGKPSYRDLELKIVGLESEIADLKDQMKAPRGRLIDAVKTIIDADASEWGSIVDIRPRVLKRMKPLLADLRKFAAPEDVFEETIGKWRIKYKKYPDVYTPFLFSARADKEVLTNAGRLCRTLEEAQAEARATIERDEKASVA